MAEHVRPVPTPLPTRAGRGVRLRAHEERDLPFIVEQCRDPLTRRWTHVPDPYDDTQARAFLALVREDWDRGAVTSPRRWAVEALDDSGEARFAGTVGYRPDGRGAAEVDFGLHPWARGRGVAVAAVQLALDQAFGPDGVHTMRWQAERGNWGSRRVAWECGFTVEAVLRGRHPARRAGPPVDGWAGSLRQDEPREPRRRWLAPPVLRDDSVVLRPWREGDGAGLDLDELAHRFVGPALPGDDDDAFRSWLLRHREGMASGESVGWCLADPRDDTPWGWLGIFGLGGLFEHGTGTVGYWTVAAARGRGAVTAALRLAADHAFAAAPADVRDQTGGLGLHRLAADTDWRNAASQASLLRAGWRWTGTHQDACVYEPDGQRFDNPTFELLARPARRPGLAPSLGPPQRLRADQVSLRPFAAADLPIVASMLQEEDFGPGCRPEAQLADAERWWSAVRHAQWAGSRHTWAVCATDAMTGAEEPIGWLAASYPGRSLDLGDLAPERDVVQVWCWIAPEHRGQGFSHEALEAVFGLLSGEGTGREVEVRARADADHGAALTVLRRTGFTEWARTVGPTGRTTVHLRVPPGADRVAAAAADAVSGLAVPVLEGRAVRLRPWRHTDAARVVEACRDPLSQHFLADLPRGYDLADARTFVATAHEDARSGRVVAWCLADPATDQALGALSLMDLHVHVHAAGHPTQAVVGYWVHPEARSRGVLTEALTMAVRHAFVAEEDGGLGLDRLALRAAAGNEASQRAARRAGFTEVGRDRRAERLGDGSFDDLVRFDLLAEEWRRRHVT